MIDVNIILKPEINYMNKVFNIAVRYNITVYDALYIVLSMEEDKPLLTLDKSVSNCICSKDFNLHQPVFPRIPYILEMK